MPLDPLVLPCLKDNFSYLLQCESTGSTVVIDPSEAAPVLSALKNCGNRLDAIWCTHHHYDHVGGVEELRTHFPSVEVFGHTSETERIPCLSKPIHDNETWSFGTHTVRALHVPGHTLGAIAFVVDESLVFTGDTLFVAGCGRLFEGTAQQMHSSLQRINALPPATRVYSGHEYAEKNLRFAQTVESENTAVLALQERVQALLQQGKHATGFRLEEEREVNPFLRVHSPAVQQFAAKSVALADPIAVFGAIREARNQF